MTWMDKVLMALKNARNQIEVLGTPTDDVNNAHLKELDSIISVMEYQNPDRNGFYYWTLKVGVHKAWVADGADFTDQRAHDMLTKYFSHLLGSELKATVLSRPPDKAVAEEMGFDSVKDYLKDRKKE